MKVDWKIPQISGEPLQISLENNEQLFIVGANGSGKSALVQHLVSSSQDKNIRRISAHRQTWLLSGSIDITPQDRKRFGHQDIANEVQNEARWRDFNARKKQSSVLYDLVTLENVRARSVTRFIDDDNPVLATAFASKSVSPFDQLNELLRIGNLAVTLQNSNDEEILAQHRDNNVPYSIAQMSDGERNAAIIAATVLTVEPDTVLLIDEPERHLHRSIIEPFLSALFECRPDCAFVISTHEIALPIANLEARVLMVRSCRWSGKKTSEWNVELLESNTALPEDLKRAILGSRERILFVEGNSNKSLDLPLYTALFPDISVVSKGSCNDVMRAVRGLKESQELHQVEAFGLIDRDNRDEDEVERLAEGGVFALNVYSVESLYYCSESIETVARRQAESLGCNPTEMIYAAFKKAFDILKQNDLVERMAARRCESVVRNMILQQIPSWKSIITKPMTSIEITAPYQKELYRIKQLVEEEKLDDLVARYPLRESGMLEEIAKALNLTGRNTYERTLISRIGVDEDLHQSLKQRIGPLAEVLDA